MRSLCFLLGGLGRFVPCSIGANHCRLRHTGWERCVVMGLLLGLGSVPLRVSWISSCCDFGTLLGLPVRCSMVHFHFGIVSTRFASRVPTWPLPMPGHDVAALVHAGMGSAARKTKKKGKLGKLKNLK